MARYLAHFQPQAWINDHAVDIDIDGPNTWDATAYLTDPANADFTNRLLAELDGDDDKYNLGVIDNDDILAGDPNAPELVRTHHGPFTITVRDTDRDNTDTDIEA